MIIGIGIDIIENKRISLNQNFIKKVLSENEITQLNNLNDEQRKIEFIAGRWAVKEALIKAYKQSFILNNVDVFFDNNIKQFKVSGLNDKYTYFVSISHETAYTVGMVLVSIN